MALVQMHSATPPRAALTFVDVFAGCGGLSLGLKRAGWAGLFAVEKDAFAFSTLSANFLTGSSPYDYHWPEWLEKKNWEIDRLIEQHRDQLLRLRGKVDLLAGGPPCQGFSSAGRRRSDDPRNMLFERYIEFVEVLQPGIVLVENVRGITLDFKKSAEASGDEAMNFSKELKRRLSGNYHLYTTILKASHFGVPQSRPRFFLIGFRKGEYSKVDVQNPFTLARRLRGHFLTQKGLPQKVGARAALSDLEISRNGTVDCVDSPGYQAIGYRSPRTAFQKAMRDGFEGTPSDTRLAKHRPEISERFRKIIEECKVLGRLNVQLSRAMRQKYGTKKMATRVLDPVKPAPTITSMPDDLLHYSEPRTLTVRENARLQTFPDWFVFKGKYTTGGDLRKKEIPRFTQVANAVPPLLAEMIGTSLREIAVAKLDPALEWSSAREIQC